MDGAHCTPTPDEENCQSTAFTVTFESAKTPNSRFIKRHIRNLSLPVVKVYDNKVITPSVFNGNETSKKPGNHSEGYFSSDAEDDHGISKMSFLKHENSPTKEEESSNDEEEERSEGAPSEAGTYTIDKESPDVVTARLSIDAKFGVKQKEESADSKEWVSDWALKASNPGPSLSNILPSKTKANLLSKIPSPITPRARLGSRSRKTVLAKPVERSRPNSPNVQMPREDSLTDNDTERYLKTTERAMSVLAARMSLSLDSGGESDNGEPRRGRPLQRSDSSASESHQSRQAGTSSTRYNRAFSLRRGRLDEGTTKKIESIPVKPISPRVVQPPRLKPSVTPGSLNNLTRNDVTRTSIRSTGNQRSPQLSTPKQDFGRKKVGVPGATGGRSNSSLSSKEVEFQNWKRRKSYDPMKAAAEGKRKEAAAKKTGTSPNVMSQSSTNATTTPKSPVNSVLRSASFHTTRQLGGPLQSSSEDEEEEEEEEEETTLSVEDWPPKLPNALEQENSVPCGSRGSLYSNNSSGGSPRHRARLEGVDNFIVSAIATISNRVNTNTAIILKKLRFLFDEESDKYKDLSSELELLEAGIEPLSSPNKSTSRDLAITLKNLKRLDSAVKVLNEVLFENVEYQ